MEYLKSKTIASLVLISAIMAEYFHLLFIGEIHSYYMRNGIKTPIYWDDMVYYFLNESFTLLLVTLVSIFLWTDRASKTLMSAIFGWFLIEWVEILLMVTKIIDIRTSTNNVSWIQLFTVLIIAILVYFFGSKK